MVYDDRIGCEMRTKILFVIALFLTITASAGPRLSLSGDVALGIPIGDLANDDLDTGYCTVPVFRGGLAFRPFSPVLKGEGVCYKSPYFRGVAPFSVYVRKSISNREVNTFREMSL